MSCGETPIPVPCYDCTPPENVSPCLDGEQCEDSINVDCVIYEGPYLPCLGIRNKDRLSGILPNLNDKFCSLTKLTTVTYQGDGNTCLDITNGLEYTELVDKIITYLKETITIATSNSLGLNRDTACNKKTLNIELIPSTDDGNTLSLGSDGKPFVPTPESVTSVNYSGAGNECLSIATGNNINAVIDKIILKLKNDINSIDSESLSITPGTGCDSNKLVIELTPSADEQNALTVGSDGRPFVQLVTLPTDNINVVGNGLHRASTDTTPGAANTVHLGGILSHDTTLGLLGYTFNLNTIESFSRFHDHGHQFFAGRTNADPSLDVITTSYLDASYANIQSSLRADYNSLTNYYAGGWMNVNKDGASIASYFPTTNTGTSAPASDPAKTSHLKLTKGKIEGYANDTILVSATAILSSGPLISGKRYQIVTSTGGANFVSSGAANNTVGTAFTSNGVTPTWGTGSLEQLGSIQLTLPYASYSATKGQHFFTASSALASPLDQQALYLVTPNYIESQINKTSEYNGVSYLTRAQMGLNVSLSTSASVAQIGVNTPNTNDGAIPAPAANAYSAYTQWKNVIGTTQGVMRTYSPTVEFTGIAGVNSGKTAINVTGSITTDGKVIIGDAIKLPTTNTSVGKTTLVAGTKTVLTASALTGSKIFVSHNTPAGTIGIVSAPDASIVNGVSFVINSSSNLDTSTVNWWIINQ